MTEAALSMLYRRGFDDYARFLTEKGWTVDSHRAEHQFECLRDWSLLHSWSDVRLWFEAARANPPMAVEDIGLSEVKGWLVDGETGNIFHESGEFFVVKGVRVTGTVTREVGDSGWDQPIVEQVGLDGGLLGILRQRFDGVPHYLIEAKAEPGNYEVVQMSPTLQATFSNLKRAHAGRKPLFAEYFEEPERVEARILYDQWLSEDGGRLHKKRNKGMLVEVAEGTVTVVPDGFIWMSMFQIKQALLENAWVNPHIRGIIAHL